MIERALGRVFDRVADAYDAARPGYPDDLFAAVTEMSGVALAGATVVDVGAGTGISTRALRARGARVVAVDPAAEMLARLVTRTGTGTAEPDGSGHSGQSGRTARPGGVAAVRGDGNALPLRDGVADLVCYAQSWHWLDPRASVAEARRVLRRTGAIAAWWNTHDTGRAEWLAAYEARLAEQCPSYWGPGHPAWRVPAINAVLDVSERWVPWTRLVGIEEFLLGLRSHSYMAALDPAAADELVEGQRELLRREFPDGMLSVPMRVYLAVGR
ncbi:class I SAM-dependent methyltransferase [Thermoactinospora rubra]|uniref:class I SAM-dependent methyltransferase n=1 Tax=Thermoactinospora rubra TaxID=1088767 RepID=UPI000A0F9D29|nr:class I SAM-dependent methyltransferase [Thermoactinospora rubra]